MKKWLFSAVAIIAIALWPTVGCRTSDSDSPPPIVATNVARAWYPGLVITFQDQPTPELLSLLALAKAKRTSGEAHGHRPVIFVIERYDRQDTLGNAAIEQALREGAVLTGWRPQL